MTTAVAVLVVIVTPGGMAAAKDAGAAWQNVPVRAPGGSFVAAACSGVSDCWASQGGPTLVHWDGKKWSEVGAAAAGVSLVDVACADADVCWAVGQNDTTWKTYAYRWDGRRWTAAVLPLPTGTTRDVARASSVTCPAANDCLALGASSPNLATPPENTILWTWNGARWSVASTGLPGGISLSAVDCPSRASCVAVGSQYPKKFLAGKAIAAVRTPQGEWAKVDLPQPFASPRASSRPTSLSCAGPERCVAEVNAVPDGLGGQQEYTDVLEVWSGGRSWSLRPLHLPSPYNSSPQLWGGGCAASGDCWYGVYGATSSAFVKLTPSGLAVVSQPAHWPELLSGAIGCASDLCLALSSTRSGAPLAAEDSHA